MNGEITIQIQIKVWFSPDSEFFFFLLLHFIIDHAAFGRKPSKAAQHQRLVCNLEAGLVPSEDRL